LERSVVLRVALSALGLNLPPRDSTLDGDRPGRAYLSKKEAPQELHRQADREADPAFTDWLGKTLHEVYDPVAREPLPSEFATLIRHLEQARPEA